MKLMSIRSRRGLVPLALAASLTLAACSSGGAGDTGVEGSTNPDAEVTVATAFYPLAWVTAQVGGDRVAVTDLTPTGSDEHDLELSPAQVDALTRDDLVVYLAGFQPAMDDAVDTIASTGAAVYDVSADVDLQPATGQHTHGEADEHDHEGETKAEHAAHAAHADEHAEHADEDAAHTDEHADEHADEHLPEGHSTDDGHDHSGLAGNDPHFWLDPARLATVATQVADRLAEIDPEGADTYRANAEATRAELTELADSIDTGLAQCERSTIVVTHEAYGYLTGPHGITMIGIAGIDPDTEPSPARIAEIEAAAHDSDATTVFGEEAVDQKVAQVVAEQTGLTYAVLDPIGSQVSEEATYPGQMQANLDALRAALECA